MDQKKRLGSGQWWKMAIQEKTQMDAYRDLFLCDSGDKRK